MTNEETREKGRPEILEEIGEKKVLAQVNAEYEYCHKIFLPRLNEWLIRLTLYNNQKRDKTKTGDPLLFTVFQTLLAVLYQDRLNVSFEPREKGDQETADNLNKMAEFDYEEMGKDIVDYEWIWDSGFFGRGLVLLQEFDRKRMHPIPQVIDPCTFLRDPKAKSVNGDVNGHNALRFWGREIGLTKYDLEKNKEYFDTETLRAGKELTSLLQRASVARREAQGVGDDLKENPQYDLVEWYTHLKGEKYLLTLGNALTKIVRVTKLEDQELWPLIDRPFFPTSHDWDGVTVPDLIEDKQRARAVLQNLVLDSARSDAYPMYLFDETRIKNRADLNFGFNKFIRVSGPTAGAVTPMHKPAVHQQVGWIMDLLDMSAQRSLGTPELQMGIPAARARTLGELELTAAKAGTRHSLMAAVFGWSDKKFWRQWYSLYKRNFKERIDEKVIRLTGAWGTEFRSLKRENVVANIDPDIKIESKIVSETDRARKGNAFIGFANMVLADPGIDKRIVFKKMGRLIGLEKYEIDRMFPPTFAEGEAEQENKIIEGGKIVNVEIGQEHRTHLEVHSKLNASKELNEHIRNHKLALFLQKKQAVATPAVVTPAVAPIPAIPVERPAVSPIAQPMRKPVELPTEEVAEVPV